MVEYRGSIIWDLSPAKDEAKIGIDTTDKSIAFKTPVALIPVLISDLIRVSAAASREHKEQHPERPFVQVARLKPESFGGERDLDTGDIELTFHVGGAPITLVLGETDSRNLAEGLQRIVDTPWKRDSIQ